MKKRILITSLICLAAIVGIGYAFNSNANSNATEDSRTSQSEPVSSQDSRVASKNTSISPEALRAIEERNARNELASTARRSGDDIGAETLYLESIAELTSDTTARLGLMTLYRKQGRLDEARDMLHVLVTEHDDWSTSISHDPSYLFIYATLCEETYLPEEANRAYRAVLEYGGNKIGEKFPKIDPTVLRDSQIKSAAHIVAGWSQSSYGDSDEVSDHFRKAVELSDDYALAHYHYAVVLKRKHQWELAISEFEAAKALDPSNELLVEAVDDYLKEIGYRQESLRRKEEGVPTHTSSQD